MVDDQPDHAGLDHQFSDPQHAGGRRPHAAAATCISARGSIPGSSARFKAPSWLQPVCGYVLDVLGLKIGFALFARRLVAGQHGAWLGARAGRRLPGCAGCSGFTEGSANPGGHEGDGGMVSRQRTRIRRRPVQYRRLCRFHARAAAGRLGDPALQLAGRFRDHRRPRPGLGGAVAAILSVAGQTPGSFAKRSAPISPQGRRSICKATARRPSMAADPAAAQFLGHRLPALPGRSHLGHADVFGCRSI